MCEFMPLNHFKLKTSKKSLIFSLPEIVTKKKKKKEKKSMFCFSSILAYAEIVDAMYVKFPNTKGNHFF